jgi:hypothetical protein
MYYNLDEFNAINDADRIQQAFDAIGEDGGGVLVIPPGRYTLDKKIWVRQPGNITIFAHQAHLIRKAGSGVNVMFSNEGPDTGYDNAGNITVEGGVWDANGSEDDFNCDVFYFWHARDIVYRNLVVRGVPDWHAIEFRAVYYGEATGCRFEGFTSPTASRAFSEAVQVQEGEDDTMCRFLKITGNTCRDFGRLVGSHTSPSDGFYSHERILVSDNTCYGLNDYAVAARGWRDAIIANNVFDRCGGGVFMALNEPPGSHAWHASCLQNIVVDGNVFENVSIDGQNKNAVIRVVGGSSVKGEDIAVSNNIIRDYRNDYGIRVDNGHEIQVTGNILKYGPTSHAICVDSSNGVVVSGNNVREATIGITVSGGDIVEEGNRETL